jgi:hypothetical protein
MPRAADAYARVDKWQGWILAAVGHGEEWARVFHAGPQDSEPIWAAIAAAVVHAPARSSATERRTAVVCGVDFTLTINDRTASVATAWHYPDADAAPRLVTAYPSA